MEFAAVGYGWCEFGFLEEVGLFKSTTWNLNGILIKQQVISSNTTKMNDITIVNDELRPEYDETSLKNGVRGKYAEQYAAGTNIVCLAPDVVAAFPNEELEWQGLIN